MRVFLYRLTSLVSIVPMLAFAQSQTYLPIGPNAKQAVAKPTLSVENLSLKRLSVNSIHADVGPMATAQDDKDVGYPECSPIPSLNDIPGGFDYKRVLLSTAVAVKLGIPVANVSTTGNQMVLVQDYSRTKTCLSNDKRTRLIYGQTIRTVITIANVDSQANLTLPVIAANATIAGKNNSLQIQVLGFSNSSFLTLVAAVTGKELNVETYGEFARIHGDLLKATAEATTTQSVALLGIAVGDEPSNLKNSVAATFAIQQISDGKSCSDAKSKYKAADASANAIDQTYGLMMNICSSAVPNDQQRGQAKDFLQGLKVSYPFWNQ